MLVQGFGWIDMANDLGGVENLSTAIFEEAPCKYCQAAWAMVMEADLDESSDDVPAPTKRSKKSEGLSFLAQLNGSLGLVDEESDRVRSTRARQTPAAEFFLTEHCIRPLAPPPRAA